MVKKQVIAFGLLALILGFLAGSMLPQDLIPWRVDRAPSADHLLETLAPLNQSPSGSGTSSSGSSSGSAQSDGSAAPFNTQDNIPLLRTAMAVVQALKAEDYTALSAFVHPEDGVTFTPYSTVEEDNLSFTPQQLQNAPQDTNRYTWGFVDGRGSLIQMTILEYVDAYVFDRDYTQATEIGIDRILEIGNALENTTEAYSDCRFVEFHYPGTPEGSGVDWSTLRLVFRAREDAWRLVGVIHGQWTI